MLRLSTKNILAHKRRLVGTALSVIIGIAFLAGTFVFTDTIKRTFDDLFSNVYAKTDVVVRSDQSLDFGQGGGTVRPRIPDSFIAQVQAVPGVQTAVGDVQGYARIIGKDNKPIAANNFATFGSSFTQTELASFHVVEGKVPAGGTEMAMDKGSADRAKYHIGDQVVVNSQAGSRTFTLAGIAKFGDADSPAGASFALFDLKTAQDFVGQPGMVDSVNARGDGSLSQTALAERVRAAVGNEGAQVLTGKQITEETQNDIEEGLSFFNILLLIFAGIALFVSVFIIYNTFSIIVAQRQRETALLRAIGASRRQVVGSLVIESIVMGIVASLIGVVAGLGLAAVLKAGLAALGIDIPAGGVVFLPRTLIVSLVVGVLITVIASVWPALAASRVPPVAAMREVAIEDYRFSKGRLIAGLIISVLGVAGLAIGLTGQVGMLAVGIPAIFIGVFVLGPLIARPVARFVGWPLPRLKGMTGTLARENASRNPKRTARTAAALMVGVSLVAGISVLAASIKSSVRTIFTEQFTGDFVINSQGSNAGGGLPPEVAQKANQLPGVAAASGIELGIGRVDGSTETLSVVDPATAGKVFDLEFLTGNLANLTTDGVMISKDTADSKHLAVGAPLTLQLLNGSQHPVTVQGIYDKDELAGAYTISKALYAESGADQYDFTVFVKKAPGASDAQVQNELDGLVKDYPIGKVQSRATYISDQAGQIDALVNLIYGLLFLAVIIAVVGITNTLSLSVYERTRELGLVRAVGATRRQIRGSVRWESVITALLGAAQGILIGILLGYAVILALRDQGLKSFTIPVASLIVVVVVAFVCGVLAAIRPARRAARLDVLRAIASE